MEYHFDTERCESGRIGLTANELTWETGSEGSNPSLSARLQLRKSPKNQGFFSILQNRMPVKIRRKLLYLPPAPTCYRQT